MEIRKTINTPIPFVFSALTDPKELTQWFPDNGIFEPEVGGKMHFIFLAGHHEKMDKDHHLDGEVLEIVPNKKLVYSFISCKEYNPDGKRAKPTIVTWSLEEAGKTGKRSHVFILDLSKKRIKIARRQRAGHIS